MVNGAFFSTIVSKFASQVSNKTGPGASWDNEHMVNALGITVAIIINILMSDHHQI